MEHGAKTRKHRQPIVCKCERTFEDSGDKTVIFENESPSLTFQIITNGEQEGRVIKTKDAIFLVCGHRVSLILITEEMDIQFFKLNQQHTV